MRDVRKIEPRLQIANNRKRRYFGVDANFPNFAFTSSNNLFQRNNSRVQFFRLEEKLDTQIVWPVPLKSDIQLCKFRNFENLHSHARTRRTSKNYEWRNKIDTYLITIVRPGGPFEGASLLVKGEEFYIYVATATEDTVAQPDDFARVTDDHICIDDRRTVLRICTVIKDKSYMESKLNSHILFLSVFHLHKHKKKGINRACKLLSKLLKSSRYIEIATST